MDAIGVADGQPSTTYSVLLSGESARTVTGDVAMHTSDGNWFTMHFANVPLSQYKEQWQDRWASFERNDYLSPVLYVQFPKPVSIASDFVSDAAATNEAVFGWNAKGSVACPGHGDPKKDARRKDSVKLMNPLPQAKLPPTSNSQILTPSISNAPGSTDCAVPFREAESVAVQQPEYPRMAMNDPYPNHTTLVAIALSAQGGIDDAWIWGPSGNRFLDDAALRAARGSKYRAARAFCQDVPGIYIFHADFQP